MNSSGPDDRAAGRFAPHVSAGEPLGFLLVAAAQLMSARIKPVFDRAHLRPRQVQLMTLVTEQPAMTQQQLIEAMHIDPSVLVGLLNDLEERGLVRRIRDPRDRRRHIVKASPAGARRLGGVLTDGEQAERAMFDHLSDDELLTLRQLLSSVLERQAASSEGGEEC